MEFWTRLIELITVIITMIILIYSAKSKGANIPTTDDKAIPDKATNPDALKKRRSVLFPSVIIISSILGLLYYIWIKDESPVTTKDLGFIALLLSNYIAGYFFLRTVKLH